MVAPPEGNVDTEPSNEIEDENLRASASVLAGNGEGAARSGSEQNCVLKNLQLEHLHIENEFFQEVCKLEQKYQHHCCPNMTGVYR